MVGRWQCLTDGWAVIAILLSRPDNQSNAPYYSGCPSLGSTVLFTIRLHNKKRKAAAVGPARIHGIAVALYPAHARSDGKAASGTAPSARYGDDPDLGVACAAGIEREMMHHA